MTKYYIQETKSPDGTKTFLAAWRADEEEVYKLGIVHPEHSAGCYFRSGGGASAWENLVSNSGWFAPDSLVTFTESKMLPGQFFPRMTRPGIHQAADSIGTHQGSANYRDLIASSATQLDTLTTALKEICQTIHPHTQNFSTYGHNIRNLLILACTEVEAQWAGVLNANQYHQSRLTTRDYVKLAPAMMLDGYSVSFSSYPWLPPISPFSQWNSNAPTTTLPWYDDYNAVKHNRETQFSKATLEQLLNSIAACYVMLIAQFGTTVRDLSDSSAFSFFQLSALPVWPIDQAYFTPDVRSQGYDSAAWNVRNFPF